MPKDFKHWLMARWLSNIAKQLLSVAVAWQVYVRTRDPLALGLVGLSSAIPFTITSLWAGHVVNRSEKRGLLMAAQGALGACAAALFFSTFGRAPLLFLYGAVALKGASVSFEMISASAFAQTIVPREGFPRAAAWNLITFSTATIAGPLAGGWLLKAHSDRAAYGLAMVFFLGAWTFATRLRQLPPAPGQESEAPTARVKAGLRFVKNQPLILGAMSLDMVAVLFGDAVALYPIFADLLKAGPVGFGLLRASPAAGAALVSARQVARPFIHPSWRQLKRVVAAFGVFMLGFALAPHLWTAALFLFLAGIVDGVSVIIRQSLYQAHTPDSLRGRVAAVSGIFISTSNEIGAFESGLSAKFLGPVGSVLFGVAMTFATVAGMGWYFRGKIREE